MSSSEQEIIPLDEAHPQQSPNGAPAEIEQPTLAPADRGRAAWLMLASCCLIQLPVWGVPLMEQRPGGSSY